MKIAIELPTWLGDAVMVSPAIENIIAQYKNSKLIFIGSESSLNIFKNHPNFDSKHKIKKDIFSLFKISKQVGEVDFFFSFRSSLRSRILLIFIKSRRKFQFNKNAFFKGHQVQKYNDFVNSSLKKETLPGKLNIFLGELRKESSQKRILGINPGASYGSAKRWYPEYFANVGIELANEFDLVIFGGKNEIDIAEDIEKRLKDFGIQNYLNLAGKTSLEELVNHFNKLTVLVTGDSGPMHIAAAMNIPTITIFGPTKVSETCQWQNKKSINLFKEMPCQPCMKRSCPLVHHNCMKQILYSDVLRAIKKIT